MRVDPPIFATWLLQHLGCSPDNDAVLGDLAERYQEGMTASWYWKQSLIAIAVSVLTELRGHRALVLRAAIVGMLVSTGIEFSIAHYLPLVPYWIPLDWWSSETLRTAFKFLVGSAVHLSLTCICGWTIVWMYVRRRVQK